MEPLIRRLLAIFKQGCRVTNPIALVMSLLSLCISVHAEVSDFPEPWAVTFLISTPGYKYTVSPNNSSSTYAPNTLGRPGIGLSYRGYGGIVTWAGETTSESQRARGSSRTTDYSLNFYWNSFAMDLFYQNYSGFYVLDTADSSGTFLQFPDASASHYGGNFYFVLSPERYSMASAFDQTMKQTESGGSWLLSGFANSFRISTGNYRANGLSGLASRYQPFVATSLNLGAGGGYGYSYRYGKWFISGQLLIGIGYQTRKLEANGATPSDGSGVGSKYTFHIGLGWSGERNCAALYGLTDGINFAGEAMKAEASTARLAYVYRF